MANESYDVVIVGAGMGGLNLGGLLANGGKKVLVLEKQGKVGGRAISGRYKNCVVDNGIHGLIVSGYQEEVYRRVGKVLPPDVLTWKRIGDIYKDGQWRSFESILATSAGELEKMLSDAVYDRTYEEIETLDDISVEKFVSEKTNNEGIRDWFSYMGWIYGGTRSTPTDMSAGSLFRTLKRQAEADKSGKIRKLGYLVQGGSGSIAPPLVEAITENGGEIRTNSTVSSVIIKDGRVQGVEVESRDRVIPTQVMDTEFIESPIVVSAVPLWDVFNIISEEDLPPWYADRIRFLSGKTLNVWTLTYGLDNNTTFDDSGVKWIQAGPVSGRPWVAGFVPFADTEGQYEVTCWMYTGWHEPPSVFETKRASVKAQVKQMFDIWEADVRELFPEVAAQQMWTIRSFGAASILETPGNVGKHLISMEPEGVEGLYLIGERTQEAEIMGIYGSAQVALKCAEQILNR